MAFLSGVRAETLKNYTFGIKEGDKVKYAFTAEGERQSGRGTVIKVYPYYFLIDNGKYKVCIGKAQLACGEHRITAKKCGGERTRSNRAQSVPAGNFDAAVPVGNYDRLKI